MALLTHLGAGEITVFLYALHGYFQPFLVCLHRGLCPLVVPSLTFTKPGIIPVCVVSYMALLMQNLSDL